MPKSITEHALPVLALVGAVLIGAWLGFSSCGGHAWHTYLGHGALAVAVLAVFTLGSGGRVRRAGLASLVVAAFVVARGAGFAAYLGADSSSEYLRQIGATLGSGLC